MKSLARLWGEAIRNQRVLLGMTQAQLAASVGVEQASVSLWETGITTPTTRNQMAIAQALHCDARVLFQFPQVAA